MTDNTVPRCDTTRDTMGDPCNGTTLERCAGAAGHRGACFGGVPPPPGDKVDRLIADRDSWRIRAEAAEALVRQMRGECDELGIQYRAAQERLRLAATCIEAARSVVGLLPDNTRTYLSCIQLRESLAAWDAVPGDAKVSP